MKFICYFLVIFGAVNSRDNCPAGEVTVSCKSPCEPSCDKPTPALTPNCKTCKVGCVCQLDLLRNTVSGRCIPPKQCPKFSNICEDENMELTPCGSKCPRTCQSPCQNNNTCILQLCVNRCQCKPGFIWDEILLKCIEPSKCSMCKCPENEIWIRCNPGCEKTCSSIKNSQKCVPVNTCTPGCICPKGFIRNEKTGKCIPINKSVLCNN